MVEVGQIPDQDDLEMTEETMFSGVGALKKNFFDGQFYSDDESDDGFGDEV